MTSVFTNCNMLYEITKYISWNDCLALRLTNKQLFSNILTLASDHHIICVNRLPDKLPQYVKKLKIREYRDRKEFFKKLNLKPLNGTRIKHLEIIGFKVDFAEIKILYNLEYLALEFYNGQNIRYIENYTKLKVLKFAKYCLSYDNRNTNFSKDISKLEFLSKLTQLEELDMHYPFFSDISILPLKNLKKLCISFHFNLKYISDMTKLEYLHIYDLEESDLEFFKNLKQLKYIEIDTDIFFDIGKLLDLPKLERLTILGEMGNINDKYVDNKKLCTM